MSQRDSEDDIVTGGCAMICLLFIAVSVLHYLFQLMVENSRTSIIILLILLFVVICFLVYKNYSFRKFKTASNIKLHRIKYDHEIEIKKINEEKAKLISEIQLKENRIRELINNDNVFKKSASLKSDAETYIFTGYSNYLEKKSHPAYRKATEIEKLAKNIANGMRLEYNEMKYKYEFLFSTFPELNDYIDSSPYDVSKDKYTVISDLKNDYDCVRDWVSKDEYISLSVTERNQLALDRYVNSRNKKNWCIGRDYELYCGYLFRTKYNYKVIQYGVNKKFNDLGRDLIIHGDNKIIIAQCKYWAEGKEIHENAICQLFGTTKMFKIEESSYLSVIPLFITNIDLSNMAKKFASVLGVEVMKIKMGEFPRIKCNINQATKEKIYHLPFDEQYDSTKIDKEGELYALTVKEAEDKGFRRANRFFMNHSSYHINNSNHGKR